MRSIKLSRLAAINTSLTAVLAAVSVLVWWSGRTSAQVAGRALGQYTMVSGKTTQGSTHAVFVIDAANQELMVMKWDASRKELVPIAYRNLLNDSKATGTR